MTAANTGDACDPNDDWPGKAKGEPEPAPDVAMMREHLELLFGGDRCAGMLDGYIEIAWTDSYGNLNHAQMFGVDELDEAADFGAERNANRGVNVYVSLALRKPGTKIGKRAKKGDVLGMTAVPQGRRMKDLSHIHRAPMSI